LRSLEEYQKNENIFTDAIKDLYKIAKDIQQTSTNIEYSHEKIQE
jgi:hypothetical protein